MKPSSSGASTSTSTICAPCSGEIADQDHISITSSRRAGDDESDEHEAQVLADGQELQMVELLGGEPDGAADGSVDRLPDEIAQRDGQPRRPRVAGRRHVDALARAEHDVAEHAPDRLGEAVGGVLRGRARIGEAAVPGRAAAHGARGEAMDDLDREQRRDRDEDEDQQAVVGAAALGDRHDRQPRRCAVCGGMRRADEALRHRRQRRR